MATPAQITMIHTLKGALWMDDETYRSMLRTYGGESSKDLTVMAAAKLIDSLRTRAIEARVFRPRKTTTKRSRADSATPAQRAKIERMWNAVSRAPREARAQALDKFIEKRFGVSKLEWVTHEMASKIVHVLGLMLNQKGASDDCDGADRAAH